MKYDLNTVAELKRLPSALSSRRNWKREEKLAEKRPNGNRTFNMTKSPMRSLIGLLDRYPG